jgi:YegS/Rv2252/BmrU family lipid kinase
MVKKVHIIINPASGQPQPILNRLNDVFYSAGVTWDISITKQSGDAARFTRQAIGLGAEVVGAYGGDGTVMEVAQALQGGEIPMAILPGGTANLMSVELGIPKDLSKAAQIMIDTESQIRRIDMGQVGKEQFMLRVGIGFAGEKVRLADRQLKDRWGILAYSIAGLKALSTVKMARYCITVDGVKYETNGKSCLIDNAGSLGMGSLTASKNISVSDGLLDVILVRDASIGSLMAVGAEIVGQGSQSEGFQLWQGHEIQIECDPPQTIQGDGEIWGETPVEARVLPGVLPVLVPHS